MHELSMCEAIARTVVDRAAGRQVLTVRVRIGHLRQVVPDTMAFCWEMLTAGTELEGAALQIEHVAATVACEACGATTDARCASTGLCKLWESCRDAALWRRTDACLAGNRW